jgi:hypothetical protein
LAGQKNNRGRRSKLKPLDERFKFLGDAIGGGDRKALRAALYEVEDKQTGFDRILKLWPKTGSQADDDLRQLWRHEARQVQRVMAYSGARETIVDVLEFVEDAENFGALLEKAGQPLSTRIARVPRVHWLRNLATPRPRALFWRNMHRIAGAIGLIHAQGLVHGDISASCVMTEGADEPDFRLTGFEWSLWLGASKADRTHAQATRSGGKRASKYSFAEDWRAFGNVAAEALDAAVRPSGEIATLGRAETPIVLSSSERLLLARLVAPQRGDSLEPESIKRLINDIVAEAGREAGSRAGAYVLTFAKAAGLGEAVYDVTNGEIPVDEYLRQLDWVRADLDTGVTLLAPKRLEAGQNIDLVTSTMVYRLSPLPHDTGVLWDGAICSRAIVRGASLHIGEREEHEIAQPIEVVSSVRAAHEMRAQLGPDALDWSAFSSSAPPLGSTRLDLVRRALVLAQVLEALVKALEVYPVEVLETNAEAGARYALLRAEPDNDRDKFAKRIGIAETSAALKRLFEDDDPSAQGRWRLSQAGSLGATRTNDVSARFFDVVNRAGQRPYRFEIDDALPEGNRIFLRRDDDIGTEQAIVRRLRNIKALSTRADLAEMLDDPWRVRRSSREELEVGASDQSFVDLDEPKQRALRALWSVLPGFFVVGPPGVGKTKLATETVRRRFEQDKATRILVCAQGHDALDGLQKKLRQALDDNDLGDVIIVRSASNNERASTSNEDVHRTGLEYLENLATSAMTRDAPKALRDRVHALRQAAVRAEKAADVLERDDRIALNAVSSLVLDAANIVISTVNSADIERMVEAREQFDWVIVEEAAKATGPELAGAMMLSGRRLFIGDHRQLPPFEADRIVSILRDHGAVLEALALAEQYVGPLLRDGELAELQEVARDDAVLRDHASGALRLFEPFRAVVEEDERREKASANHRSIAATLTEQRRMDPAIARIVSKVFYDGILTTEKNREAASSAPPPFEVIAPLPASPVVAVEFKHVSATGSSARAEHGQPRWHNPGEVNSVIDVLRHVRAREGHRPSLAILSFYTAQVRKLQDRIKAGIGSGQLAHLRNFIPVRPSGDWVGTVDSFQGSEADLVILSLVRNNPRTGAGAVGFLRDRRRMNVALSRAKSKLILVGSLAFLREAVEGVNPDAQPHDLEFLSDIVREVSALSVASDAAPAAASFIAPEALGRSKN